MVVSVALVVAAAAMPIGGEEGSHDLDAFMHNQAKGFHKELIHAQTQAHPDLVSQALSDGMDDSFSEDKELQRLVKDNEHISGDKDPELGESDKLPLEDSYSQVLDGTMAKSYASHEKVASKSSITNPMPASKVPTPPQTDVAATEKRADEVMTKVNKELKTLNKQKKDNAKLAKAMKSFRAEAEKAKQATPELGEGDDGEDVVDLDNTLENLASLEKKAEQIPATLIL